MNSRAVGARPEARIRLTAWAASFKVPKAAARVCRAAGLATSRRIMRVITPRDPCPGCGGENQFGRGIEVGHVFKLGTKYSKAMKAMFLDEQGMERPFIMGC